MNFVTYFINIYTWKHTNHAIYSTNCEYHENHVGSIYFTIFLNIGGK